ncbi:ABC transporter permease [Puia dinghuensis]|uniref:ABC transporter permease n=1 Tax=Puia dinghuensis TaxID=1792502 RepID=A0A8J2XQW9_9BACT|nr:ABC transporter permease [Puia dinghuensis]GGA86448.1 ABC transporter permease [Puia dinghuensis]
MFYNYFKIAIRSLLRRKDYSVLNIAGLTTGLACCLLLFQYVAFEKGYDAFPKADRIARLRLDTYQHGNLIYQSATSYPPFGPLMKQQFPEIEDYCRLSKADLLLSNDERDLKFREEKGYYADPSFLPMFDVQVIKGDSRTALSGLDKIMLSEELARKYFGNVDPLGKKLVYRAPYFTKLFEVSGVFHPLAHSHLVVDYLLSYATVGSYFRLWGDQSRPEETSWGWDVFYTYLLLRPGTDIKKLEAKFPGFCDRYVNNVEFKRAGGIRNEVYIMPLTDIHLHSDYGEEAEVNGNQQTVTFLFLVALFILCIAWVNYINLATARSLERAREVGVRKVIGATRLSLVRQFLVEGILINLASFFIALMIAGLVTPWFKVLISEELPGGFYLPPTYWTMAAFIFIVGTLLSGTYPAFILSGFKAASILKGSFKSSTKGLILRKGLIIFQCLTSIVLVAGMMIVYCQINFMRSQPLGVDISQMLVVNGASSIKDTAYQGIFQPFKHSVLQLPGVMSLTASTSTMGKENTWTNRIARSDPGYSNPLVFRFLGVDEEFIPAYGMKLVAGRNFSPTDSSAGVSEGPSVIINETAARMLGFSTPEQAINMKMGVGVPKTIIGVVQDYHTESFHKIVYPQWIILRRSARNFYSIKISSRNIPATIAAIREKWKTYFPNDAFDYYFLDEFFDKQYAADRHFGAVFGVFAGIAMVIACLGILGLAAYNIQQRTKEIGIRKVLGASVKNIMYQLSKDFVKLIILATLTGVPVTWWIMHTWLQQFAYRIEIGWWTFLAAGCILMILSMGAISFQAIKAATANPTKSLRME